MPYLTQQTAPSYKNSFARSASESVFPGLWVGLKIAWIPSLGIQGRKLFNQVSGGPDIEFHATLPNSAWGTGGETGTFVGGDGSTDYKLITTGTPLADDFDACTIFARFRSSSWVSNLGVFGRNSAGGNGNISLKNDNSTDTFEFVADGVTLTAQVGTTDASLYDGNWKTATGVRRAEDNHELWLNGTRTNTGSSNTGSIANASNEWQILSLQALEWDGDVAECMFWARDLLPAELAQLDVDPLCLFRKRTLIPFSTGAAEEATFLPRLTLLGVG